MLISSQPSPSQKECETNPSREPKSTAVFDLPEEKSQLFTHRSHGSEHNKSTSQTKSSLLKILFKNFVCRPEIGRKYVDKLNPEPGPIYIFAQNAF